MSITLKYQDFIYYFVMKSGKILPIVLVLSIVILVAGCAGGGEQPEKVKEGGAAPTEGGQAVKDVYALGDTVKLGGLAFTVSDYQFNESYQYTQEVAGEVMLYNAVPDQGNIFLFVKVSAENIGDDSLYTPSDIFALSGGSQYETALTASYPEGMEEYETYKKIIPGVTEKGWRRFEVPEDTVAEDVTVTADLSKFFGEKFVKWKLVG